VRAAVVGGGIAGLAAAWELRDEAEVTVFEPGPIGGRLQTSLFEGKPVDEGPDAFLLRVPDGLRLCQEVGLADELLHPATGHALVWSGGRLRPLPSGLVLGVPKGLLGIAGSGLLSPTGLLRAAAEPLLPRTKNPGSLTVRQLVGQRFGYQVADRLVDPLLGGIHAGSTASLAAMEVAPQLVAAAQRSRSLLMALRKATPAGGSDPVFAAPQGGMGSLVDKLVEGLAKAGVRFVPVRVASIAQLPDGRVELHTDFDPFDAAVLALPAPAAAQLVDIPALHAIAQTPAASVVIVTASFEGSVLPRDSSGFLVPRTEGKLITACSFASTKWPHWASANRSLVRISAGHSGDARAIGMPDETLVQMTVGELSAALGRQLDPVTVRVSRWPDAFPQYTVGHSARVEAAETELARELPGVSLAGAWYRGSGIPACVASGRAAARRALSSSGSRSNRA
jgi:oxygen-dependent protoporphyrinogen oxidase